MNKYKGYGLFNDVENKKLQAYNRVVTMSNIICDTTLRLEDVSAGKEEGTKYANHFQDSDKLLMKEVARIVEGKGVTAAREYINA